MLGNEVIVEVSQSRQPCWKLNARFDQANMAELVQQTGKNGWYYRVLQTRQIRAGEVIKLLHRPYTGWTLTKVNQVMFASQFDQQLFNAFLQLPLPSSWRKTIEQRLATGQIEDMAGRLYNQPHN